MFVHSAADGRLGSFQFFDHDGKQSGIYIHVKVVTGDKHFLFSWVNAQENDLDHMGGLCLTV